MTSITISDSNKVEPINKAQSMERWHNFEEILQRLHKEGIYIHSDQLAEFMLAHGLPVDLRYVPKHLQAKANKINSNYQGDMVELTQEADDMGNQFPWLLENNR